MVWYWLVNRMKQKYVSESFYSNRNIITDRLSDRDRERVQEGTRLWPITFSVRFMDARHTQTEQERERERARNENIMVFLSVFVLVRWLLYMLCTFLCAYRTKTFYQTHANNTRMCFCSQNTSRERNVYTDSCTQRRAHTPYTQTHVDAGRQASSSSPCIESIIFIVEWEFTDSLWIYSEGKPDSMSHSIRLLV